MTFDIRQADLTKLNSLTKYPSIPTYHAIDGANGQLLEDAVPFAGDVIGTEKIDGTNARLIFLPDGSFVVGSREILLYAAGDLIGDPAQGIVSALKETAERINPPPSLGWEDNFPVVQVFYLEVFGGNVSAASKQYTGAKTVSFRLFDAVQIPDFERLLAWEPLQIAHWRDAGGQPFIDETHLQGAAEKLGLPLAPRLFTLDAAQIPRGVSGMAEFLQARLPNTLCALDEGAAARPEGIVLRSASRSVIAKARFEDYTRTLRKRH